MRAVFALLINSYATKNPTIPTRGELFKNSAKAKITMTILPIVLSIISFI